MNQAVSIWWSLYLRHSQELRDKYQNGIKQLVNSLINITKLFTRQRMGLCSIGSEKAIINGGWVWIWKEVIVT
jgi:hypothetical protein